MIKKFRNHPLIIKALDVPHRSVLDLGCGFPSQLYILYHDYNFKTLIGVDNATEDFIIKEYIRAFAKNNKTIGPFENLYEMYKSQITFDPENDPEDIGKEYMTAEEFYKNVPIQPYDIKTFLNLYLGKKFDFLIMSHILPLFKFEEQKQIFEKAHQLLNPGGIIFVKANHEENSECPAQYTHSTEWFHNFFKDYEPLCFCESDNDNTGGIKSLTYFGIKK